MITSKTLFIRNLQPFNSENFQKFSKSKNLLLTVYANTNNIVWLNTVLVDIKKAFPTSTIIGASTMDLFYNGKTEKNNGVSVSVISFEETTAVGFCIENVSDSYNAGKELNRKVKKNTKAIIAFCDATNINGEELLDGLADIEDTIPIIGGLASTRTFSDTFVIFDTKVIYNGIVGITLNSASLRAHSSMAFGWQSMGKEHIITKADGNKIHTINKVPALHLLEIYLGENTVEHFPGMGSAFPLMVRRKSNIVARGILAIDGKSIIVSGNVKVGDRIHIGYGSPYEVVENNQITKDTLEDFGKPEFMLNCYCIGRRFFLEDKIVKHEIESLKQLGNSSGFFTLGEFLTQDSPQHLNFSLTALCLSESKYKKQRFIEPKKPQISSAGVVAEGLYHFMDVRIKELDYLAYHDQLTNLPNRTLFQDRVEHAITNTKRHGLKTAILFIDLDKFKYINDTLGHNVGDIVLQKIATAIQKSLRDVDTLARLGGDEFAVLLEEISDEKHAVMIVSRMLDNITNTLPLEDKKLTVTASIGIAMYPEDGDNYITLIQNADAAMYKAKAEGRNSYSFYRKDLTLQVERMLEMQNSIRESLKHQHFQLYYQPQFDIDNGDIIGAEALLRCKKDDKLMTPDFFIPIAEDSGLIFDIDLLVLDMACKQIKKWMKNNLSVPKIGVNLSAREFEKPGISETIKHIITENKINPEKLEIEITEGATIKDKLIAMSELAKIHNLGITIAMDDFGTGYSSLSHIKKLPIQKIKIDKSFVFDIGKKSDNIIIDAIIAMAKALGLGIIAEGVETKDQLEYLKKQGCEHGQGYLVGKPMRVSDFEKFLSDKRVKSN